MSSSEFIKEWFDNPDWWFNASSDIDEYLRDKYAHLLHQSDNTLVNSYHFVVIFDQLPRHIYRHTPSNHVILYYLQKSLTCLVNVDLESLSPQEWCFAMLPYRHTQSVDHIHYVMQQGWKKLKETNGDDQIKRFLKATYERCPLQDQLPLIITYDHIGPYNSDDFRNILSFGADDIADYPINIEKDCASKDLIMKNIQYHIESLQNRDNKLSFIISLSGGVDSMVCLQCFRYLQSQYGYDLQAVHINYSNRVTSDAEERFVAAWTKMKDVSLYSRRIREIRRGPCMEHDLRNLYESYTRNVRYSTYKSVNQSAYVVLGHNKDDCLENIFQNISHHTKYDDLRGMSYLSIQDGIKFFRPLLDVPKDDIISFAKSHKIPFLPNSTPTWSQRGQIRNKIVPVLNEWNEDLIPGMHDLSTIVSDMYKMSMMYIDERISLFKQVDNITRASFPRDDPSLLMEVFWRRILQSLYPNEKISKRSLVSFIERLRQNNTHNKMRFNLNKNMQITCGYKKDVIIVEFTLQTP